MWGLCVLLLVGGARAMEEDRMMRAPPYVQSRTAFTHTRLYLQESIPREENDITDVEARKHFAFGIVAAVTATIAQNHSSGGSEYHALAILDKYVPLAWENYNVVSNRLNQLLAEASLKIQPITNLIDALCSTTDSVEQCNNYVQDKVTKSSAYIQNRAKLLLALGRACDTIARHELELDTVARDYTVVPYLLKHIQTQPYKNFIKALAYAYTLLRANTASLTH